MEITTIIIIFLIGLISSFIGSLSGGGGGLISMPALTFLGLPPNIAVATNRFGSLGVGLSSTYKFAKAKKIVFKYAFPLMAISVIGSVIGAKILIEINQELLTKLIGFLIIFMLPFIFIKNKSGIKRKVVGRSYKIFGFIAYSGLAVYDGFFGAGAGIFATYILVFLLGLTYIESNATDKIAWLLNGIVSTVIFAFYGLINYFFGIILLAGMLIGGYFGAHTAIKKGNNFVRILFSIVVLVSALKLIFF